MPPKTAVSPDAFLAACIKHAKEKVVVNFDALAQEVGMSSGGAANKFRLMMKQLEEQGAAWAANKDTDGSGTAPAAKSKPASKRKTAPAPAAVEGNATENDEGAEGASEDVESPKKKVRTTGGTRARKANAPSPAECTNAAVAPKKGRKKNAPKPEPMVLKAEHSSDDEAESPETVVDEASVPVADEE